MNNRTLLRIFLELLAINSPSKKERRVKEYIVKQLSGIADRIHKDDAGRGFGGNCGNVIAKFKGRNASAPTVLLASHMDTVTETADLKVMKKNGIIRSHGTTILGADDKAGIAIMLAIAHELKKSSVRKKLGDVEMLFTPAEEIGLHGVTHLDYSLITAKTAYVLDSNEPVGFITTSSPSAAKINARIQGKTAHAGVEPEKGINAIVLASKAISKMRLGRLDQETTANIGIISGGKATNIVPELVAAEGECRSFSGTKLERQTKHMKKRFVETAQKNGGRAEVEIKKSFTTYSIGKNEPVVKAARAAARHLGIRFKSVRSGGGSDANVLNQQGIRSVVVGSGFKRPHTEHEEIAVKDLELGSRYVLEIIKQACAP